MPSTEDRSKGIGGKGTAKAILTQGVAGTDAPQGFKYRGLPLLIENGLISYDSDTQHYNITDKGKEFVQIYERMAEHLPIDQQQRGKSTPPRK